MTSSRGATFVSSASLASTQASSSFLALVIDLNPTPWADESSTSAAASSSSPIATILPVLLIFLNSHLALSPSNGVAVYACSTDGRARLIYSTASHARSSAKGRGNTVEALDAANTYQHFGHTSRVVTEGIQDMLSEMQKTNASGLGPIDPDEIDPDAETALVKVLSMALAHLNRVAPSGSVISGQGSDAFPPSRYTSLDSSLTSGQTSTSGAASTNLRILVLSTTSSASNQYIGLMNCIFAAQRREIPIDVLKIAGTDTVFLQQAASLTGGLYFRLTSRSSVCNGDITEEDEGPPSPQQLLQLLLSTFLPPPSLRQHLYLPALDEVDFRASCFCHGEIVDVGYVCGVCLSIFCSPPSRCFVCNSAFPKRTLRKFASDLTAPRKTQNGDSNVGQEGEEVGAQT